MTLDVTPAYPFAGCYVLKLHRDALHSSGRLCGRLEHVATGESVEFATRDGLVDWLLRHASQALAPAPSEPSL